MTGYGKILKYMNSNVMHPLLKVFIPVFLFSSFPQAQVRVGEWKALTSPLDVRDVISLGDVIYGATEGGLFQIKEGVYTTFTTIEGLKGVDLSSIAVDNESNLWIGGESPFGFLQVYNPDQKESVASFDFGLTAILDIKIQETVAWVLFKDGQDTGIMKFIHDQGWEYRDSYRNYPAEAGTIHCFAVHDSTVLVGMTYGLYAGQISENLKDPNSWSSLIPGLNLDITSMDLADELLVFTSKTGLFEYSVTTGSWNEIDFSYSLEDAGNILIGSDGYWFTDGNKLYRKTGSSDVLVEDRYELSRMTQQSGQTIAGLKTGLLFIDQNSDGSDNVARLMFNAPVTGGFSAITVLDDGRLVGGSTHGISIYSGEGWRNILEIESPGSGVIGMDHNFNSFIADTVSFNFGEYIADLEQGPDGLLYCAIRGSRVYLGNPPRWSGGVIVMDVDDPSNISTIDTTFLSYHTSSNNSVPYQVVLDIEFDSDGNMWVANPYCINGNNPIHVRSPNDEWKHYGSSETATRISQSPVSIAFDTWNRTWVSAFLAEEANLGIYPNGGISMLYYEGLPYNPANFTWEIIKYEGTVWSLGMGFNDRLYYLTPSGLNYYDINNGSNPVIRENSYAYFPNISFGRGAGIDVDHQGNIWTHSPTQGVHVLLENTTYWPDINGFRSSNSPLLSDEVRDIAFDEKRNLVYIATSKGVNILRIPFGQEKLDYSGVKVFPSPFYIPPSKPMKVDGLIFESSMMVMTLDGKIVRHIPTRGIGIDGDQLSWDGRDEAGDYVSSGVYLLAIYGKDGSQIMEKITVIKK